MPEQQLFEYAVIRVVPRVEREEFLNAGVIVYCPGLRFLSVAFEVSTERLLAMHPGAEVPDVIARLAAFGKVCAGGEAGGPIGRLPLASRFRWLTAARSTIIQSSPVHSGLCDNPQETLERLMKQLVG
jgi:Protein of unknown function (DUF3037)